MALWVMCERATRQLDDLENFTILDLVSVTEMGAHCRCLESKSVVATRIILTGCSLVPILS